MSNDEHLLHGHRSGLLRQLRARPRVFVAAAVGLLTAWLLPAEWTTAPATRALLAWNASVLLYVVLALVMMVRSSHDKMRLRARIQDEGRYVLLMLVIVAATASLVAIVLHLGATKEMQGLERLLHIALAGFTIAASWAFIQVMFALHYAHDYYIALAADDATGGLDFPGTAAPDYGDFLYFSCVIGTSGQTADVATTSQAMRRVVLVHCVFAFLFNATLLALTINIAAGLI